LLLFGTKSNQVPGAPNGQVILVGVLDETGEIVERHDISLRVTPPDCRSNNNRKRWSQQHVWTTRPA
jgi:hypothetical protein